MLMIAFIISVFQVPEKILFSRESEHLRQE